MSARPTMQAVREAIAEGTNREVANGMLSRLWADSHKSPCKYVFGIFVAASALTVTSTVLFAVLGWSINRTVNAYDETLRTHGQRMEQLVSQDTKQTEMMHALQRSVETISTKIDTLHE